MVTSTRSLPALSATVRVIFEPSMRLTARRVPTSVPFLSMATRALPSISPVMASLPPCSWVVWCAGREEGGMGPLMAPPLSAPPRQDWPKRAVICRSISWAMYLYSLLHMADKAASVLCGRSLGIGACPDLGGAPTPGLLGELPPRQRLGVRLGELGRRVRACECCAQRVRECREAAHLRVGDEVSPHLALPG